MRIILVLALAFINAASAQPAPDREVRARVINSTNSPIANAAIIVHAVTRNTGTRYGLNPDVESSAKSDASGQFTIRGTNPFVSITVTVEAPGYAKGVFSQLTTGESIHELKLLQGAAITGTVMKNDQPLSNIRVGLSDSERGSEIYRFNATAQTDAEGKFTFTNLPPRRSYFIYGVMDSLREHGAITTSKINVGQNGSISDTGILRLEPALVLEGRIDSPALPSKTKVTLGRDGPRDIQSTEANTQGRFRFTGVPAEIVSITAEIPGQRLSAHNGSLFPPNPNQLLGRLITNKMDLILAFEPGAELPPLNVNPFLLREEILRGAESSTRFPNAIRITGQISNTPEFTVTEGRFVSSQIAWFTNRLQRFTNSVFDISMIQTPSPAALLIESDGFVPQTIITTNSTNVTLALKPGPSSIGTILTAGGQPAANAFVFLTDTNGSLNMEGPPLQFSPFQNPATRQTKTDSQGRFHFPIREGDSIITAWDDSGFATGPLAQANPLRLQPWANVEGILRFGDQPAPNEVIRLNSMPPPYDWYPREFPPLSISLRTRTDTNGHFQFEQVPPVMMEISHSPMISDKAPEPIETSQNQRLALKPGQTVRVNLGGEGRPVIGRVQIEGYDGTIAWNTPALFLETVSTNAPSDGGLTNFLARLESTTRGTEAEKSAAETAYQRERKTFAEANQAYYATPSGLNELLASRRYLLQFNEDGAFQAIDVPAGRYRVRFVFSNGRRALAIGEKEILVPAASGKPPEPFDVGVIKLPALPGK